MHAATSKVENLAQGLSCKLKFVHAKSLGQVFNLRREQNIKPSIGGLNGKTG